MQNKGPINYAFMPQVCQLIISTRCSQTTYFTIFRVSVAIYRSESSLWNWEPGNGHRATSGQSPAIRFLLIISFCHSSLRDVPKWQEQFLGSHSVADFHQVAVPSRRRDLTLEAKNSPLLVPPTAATLHSAPRLCSLCLDPARPFKRSSAQSPWSLTGLRRLW